MTYIEEYRQCDTLEKMKEKAIGDVKIAIFLGGSRERIKAIEDAMNKVAREKGW